MVFKPLLAGKLTEEDFPKLNFPMIASCKLDGIRVLSMNNQPLTRTLKTVPNKFIQDKFYEHASILEGLDGELIVGEANGDGVFERTSSGVMSQNGEPNFSYYVFDLWNKPELSYKTRLSTLETKIKNNYFPSFVKLTPSSVLHRIEHVEMYEQACLKLGYEGIMLRSPDGNYKHGRSSLKEQILLKLKRLDDMEVRIVGFEEEQENTNEATKDAFGRTKRSSHQSNKVAKGTLGAFVVVGVNGPFKGVTFNVGTGLDAIERTSYWNVRNDLLGRYATIAYFSVGSKDKPRHPRWKGFRDELDFEVET